MFDLIRISHVMTPLPLTIDIEQTLAEAKRRMSELNVRHLPVLEGERLVGILSDRDVALASGVGATLEATSVGTAMTAGPYAVGPEEPLVSVLAAMWRQNVGSALVVKGAQVVGVFTMMDAVRLLGQTLKHPGALTPVPPFPTAVRERLRKEHHLLREMVERAKACARPVLEGGPQSGVRLEATARDLYQALLRHIELEDEVLAPLLAETPVSGPIRAELLLERHRRQRHQLQAAQAHLDKANAKELAAGLLRLCEMVIHETADQDQTLVTAALLHDDIVQTDAAGA
jgi:acetoin utilization protein AcuB